MKKTKFIDNFFAGNTLKAVLGFFLSISRSMIWFTSIPTVLAHRKAHPPMSIVESPFSLNPNAISGNVRANTVVAERNKAENTAYFMFNNCLKYFICKENIFNFSSLWITNAYPKIG
ncbi:Uncharacterised protein [Chlamydia abortus]|nr:Uncharacterised protein [Chlamydia abortus]